MGAASASAILMSASVQLPTLTAKDPFDVVDFGYDFSPFILQPGDYITTIDGINIQPLTAPALFYSASGIVSGVSGQLTAVGMTLASGAVGSLYTVSTKITTYAGEQFSRSFMLPVQMR